MFRLEYDISRGSMVEVELTPEEVSALAAVCPTTEDLLAYAAARRYEVETGGVVVSDIRIDTSRASQSMIAGAMAFAQVTNLATVEFKASSGWVTLTGDQLKAVAIAVATHVQRCFASERLVAAAIAAGTVTTFAEIDELIVSP